jgi:hypothetical protein
MSWSSPSSGFEGGSRRNGCVEVALLASPSSIERVRQCSNRS